MQCREVRPNKALQRRPCRAVLMLWPFPFVAPLNASVRRNTAEEYERPGS